MKQPTEQERKELWEWCGFTPNKQNLGRGSEYLWVYPDAQLGTLPPIDLNNLFKYAVPRLLDRGYWIEMQIDAKKTDVYLNEHLAELPEYMAVSDDPALALFWAIKQVMEGEKCGA